MQRHVHEHLRAHARQDPTKTTVVRRRFERDLVRRLRVVEKEIIKVVGTEDGFGLDLKTNAQFGFPTSTQKVTEFMKWINKQWANNVLEVIPGTTQRTVAAAAWQNVYLRSAYQKGLASAYNSLRAAGASVSQRFIDAAFYRPIHADKVGLIFTRVYSDLRGITESMDRRISRSLADSLLEGSGAMQTAENLAEVVSGLGVTRARALARTETIRAHAEGTLNSFEEAGIEGVEVQSEFSTAGDESVCPECEELEGQVYSVSEAHGIIPVHPNCRCAWLPVVEDAREIDLR